jgi:hypothetical protein
MITIQTLGRAAAIAAAATLAIATPVSAFAAPIPATPAPAKAAPAAEAAVRYCTIDEIGGSRFTKRTCKTRDAWIRDEDFDPVASLTLMHK